MSRVRRDLSTADVLPVLGAAAELELSGQVTLVQLEDGELVVLREQVAHRAATPMSSAVLEQLAAPGGPRSLSDLAAAVDPAAVNLPALASTIAELVRAGVTRIGPERAVAPASVALVSLGAVPGPRTAAAASAWDVSDDVAQALSAAGYEVVMGAVAPTALLLCGDYLDPDVPAAVTPLLANGSRVLLARVGGEQVWLGPLLEPGDRRGGPCLDCITGSLRRNVMPVHAQTLRPGASILAAARPSPVVAALAAGLLATAVHGIALGQDGGFHEGIRIWATPHLSPVLHAIRPLHGCRCQAAPADRTTPNALRRNPSASDGADRDGLRSVTAEDFLRATNHLVSAVTGIVGPLETLSDEGDPAAELIVRTTHALRTGSHGGAAGWGRAVAHGRGRTLAGARAAAVGEAVERYCASWHGDEETVRATAHDLGPDALLPQDLLLYSDAQRAAARSRGDRSVPAPLPLDLEVDWVPLEPVRAGRTRWVPAAAVLFGVPDDAAAHCAPDSNGCAAGATRTDAVLAGLLELVERDAVALWWYPGERRPGIRLESLGSPEVLHTRERLARRGRGLWLLDLTTDLDIPVVVALSHALRGGAAAFDPADTGDDVLFGFGAHLDGVRAAERAVGELGQALAAAADLRAAADPARTAWSRARLGELPFVLPRGSDRPGGSEPVTRGPGSSGSSERDVERLAAGLATRGLEVLVHDLSRSDVGVAAVRVLVPGLRPWYRRLAPGRLRVVDGPGELGADERWCNPWPLCV